MKMYAVLSDIHGNMNALEKVIEDMKQYVIDGCILLGDLIDYGMQSNEVVNHIENSLDVDIICNIWGNHERAIMLNDYTRFSSSRGIESAKHTAKVLNDNTRKYLISSMIKEGIKEFMIGNKRCLAVHGSLEDNYWKSISPDNVRGDYSSYDIVFSGHSHYSHFFTKFYDAENPHMRNKHAVRFINPGSVGQPRNHNPAAQYALLDIDTMAVILKAVTYDVEAEMALYDGSLDDFYRIRLERGI